MLSHRCGRILLLASLLAALAAAPAARADVVQQGYLYVSDYGASVLDRFQFTYNVTAGTMSFAPAGNAPGSAVFLGNSSTAPVKEGVHGTATDLIIVGGYHGNGVTNITRYTLGGQIIGEIPVNFSAYNGGNVGIGNVLVTPDGRYMYAPLEAGNAVVKIDLTNGAIVASYTVPGAHDVAIAPNGDVYVANYANANAQIIRLDANLNFLQVLVPHTTGFRPSGLTISPDGNTLYVNNNDNTTTGSDQIRTYALSGTTTLTATLDLARSYMPTGANGALQFSFGNNLGPDGNLYIAALGGGGKGSFNVQTGYVDGIYQFNTTTGLVTRVIAGFTEKTGPLPSTLFSAPKYLQFDTNFVTAPDAGYLIPEPATMALLLTGLAGLGACARRRSAATAR